MKTNLFLNVGSIFCLSTLVLAASAAAPISHKVQHPLAMPESESPKQRVRGHNDVFYGPIPKAEQIFNIDFLEIAPTPVPVSRYFFVLLRGETPPSTRQKLHLEPAQLSDTTLSITVSAVLDEKDGGGIIEPRTYSIPLRTAQLAEGAQLSIRNATGVYVDYMAVEGSHDVLADVWIPGMFVQKGTYTFEVVASIGRGEGEKQGACLFALTLTQWLGGEDGW
ncbi:hypothetical protein QBC34DRAFT_42238 [Podospora aff. communis PSN243]|uniref:Ubiquitin 3 binding protein But2 C-terminal domain-containing protein n=1 Tax=Podospora aff. communis PSN243 TaxID=3040156 RepID=A0AAV9GWX7_9PEZI|nr:hypothetical protein QBC34DRAFT_42238 [Podospora aff. communis PSN243]